jgi:membrane protein DedA with SNARE-associated domain/phosphatidylglycerophosphate synthase
MNIVDWVDSVSQAIPATVAWLLGGMFALLESGLGLGFVVPGETVVLLLSATMSTWPLAIGMFVAVTIGASVGDHVGYLIGRRFGPRLRQTKLVRRLGIGNWDRAVGVLERRGAAAVFFTRLLPVVRTLTPAAAGVARLRYRSFLPASLAGAGLWAGVYVGTGFFVRGSLDAIQGLLGHIGLYVALGLVAAVVVGFAVRAVVSKRRRKAGDRAERGPVIGESQPSGARNVRRLIERITGGGNWRTIPNYITFARIALLPFVLVLLANRYFAASLAVAVVVFASDWVDGFLARRTGTASALGAWLDPVADRLAVIVVAVGFALGNVLPWEYVGLLLIPDILLGIIAVVAFRGTPDIAVTRTGKIRTGLIFTGFAAMLVGMALGENGIANAGSAVGWGFLIAIAGLMGHYIAVAQYAHAMLKRWSNQREAAVQVQV